MTKEQCEYMMQEFDLSGDTKKEEIERFINSFAKQGWRLVSVTKERFMYFERKIKTQKNDHA